MTAFEFLNSSICVLLHAPTAERQHILTTFGNCLVNLLATSLSICPTLDAPSQATTMIKTLAYVVQ